MTKKKPVHDVASSWAVFCCVVFAAAVLFIIHPEVAFFEVSSPAAIPVMFGFMVTIVSSGVGTLLCLGIGMYRGEEKKSLKITSTVFAIALVILAIGAYLANRSTFVYTEVKADVDIKNPFQIASVEDAKESSPYLPENPWWIPSFEEMTYCQPYPLPEYEDFVGRNGKSHIGHWVTHTYPCKHTNSYILDVKNNDLSRILIPMVVHYASGGAESLYMLRYSQQQDGQVELKHQIYSRFKKQFYDLPSDLGCLNSSFGAVKWGYDHLVTAWPQEEQDHSCTSTGPSKRSTKLCVFSEKGELQKTYNACLQWKEEDDIPKPLFSWKYESYQPEKIAFMDLFQTEKDSKKERYSCVLSAHDAESETDDNFVILKTNAEKNNGFSCRETSYTLQYKEGSPVASKRRERKNFYSKPSNYVYSRFPEHSHEPINRVTEKTSEETPFEPKPTEDKNQEVVTEEKNETESTAQTTSVATPQDKEDEYKGCRVPHKELDERFADAPHAVRWALVCSEGFVDSSQENVIYIEYEELDEPLDYLYPEHDYDRRYVDRPLLKSYNVQSGQSRTLVTFLGNTEHAEIIGWSPSGERLGVVITNLFDPSYPDKVKIFILDIKDGSLVAKKKFNYPLDLYTLDKATNPQLAELEWTSENSMSYQVHDCKMEDTQEYGGECTPGEGPYTLENLSF